MLYRYNLKVGYMSKTVFDGYFSSINQLVKFACSFSDDCVMEAFDHLFGNVLPLYSLISEFERNATGI